jgi:DNA-binding NarL/FixJ family response regulator
MSLRRIRAFRRRSARVAASRNGASNLRSYPDRVVLRCLIVDDNPGFLDAARALLEQEGVAIVGVASNAADAVRSAAALRPDVTLLDIDLDGESGFEVARRLAAEPGLDSGLMIMISAHSEDDFVDLIEASPAIGFVGKPALSAAAIDRLVRAAGGPRSS